MLGPHNSNEHFQNIFDLLALIDSELHDDVTQCLRIVLSGVAGSGR